jgi:hypothetical protein
VKGSKAVCNFDSLEAAQEAAATARWEFLHHTWDLALPFSSTTRQTQSRINLLQQEILMNLLKRC